jgi:hypothetical protein
MTDLATTISDHPWRSVAAAFALGAWLAIEPRSARVVVREVAMIGLRSLRARWSAAP